MCSLRSPLFTLSLITALVGCSDASDSEVDRALAADLILNNATVYSLNWPTGNPPPADQAALQAIAIADGMIVGLGTTEAIERHRTPTTQMIDLRGATVLPGLIESHTHVFELGKKLEEVDLVGAKDEAEAIARVVARSSEIPEGDWIIGHGWDEGAWANSYPDKLALSNALPNHPVLMQSLHGFAVWGNQRALDEAGIAAETPAPVGGEIGRLPSGEPSGLFLNRATELLRRAVPTPSDDDLERQVLKALEQMAQDGYVAVHEAGTTGQQLRVLEALEASNRLPVRFYAMLSLREPQLIEQWLKRGPDNDNNSMLVTRAVKAYYDGALGSRGAKLLSDYSDRPGHRGISGAGYAFDTDLASRVIEAGFQIAIHAIGDAGNRDSLDLIEKTQGSTSERHRIEHAQVIHPDDIQRFKALGVIASMQPPHAVEDMHWAEDRVGPQRIQGAYAWRTLRDADVHLVFNADNPGSDHNIFYGLHAAVTRRDKERRPESGWYPQQALSMDESLRAYTQWGAYASFRESETGVLAEGNWADITVFDIDPFALAANEPDALLDGKVLMTIINGEIVHNRLR